MNIEEFDYLLTILDLDICEACTYEHILKIVDINTMVFVNSFIDDSLDYNAFHSLLDKKLIEYIGKGKYKLLNNWDNLP